MKPSELFARLNNRKGSVTITVALLLVVLIGFAALAVDVGYMMVKRNELQNTADAAALGAAGALGSIYSTMTYSAQQDYVSDPAAIDPVAQALASSMSLSIPNSDITIGQWNPTTNVFTPGLANPDAVMVTARRDSTVNGPVPTFLAGVIGINSYPVSATATAAFTSLQSVPAGGLPLPVGISIGWFSTAPNYCSTPQPIILYPTTGGCVGWNTYTEGSDSPAQLDLILTELTNESYQSPTTIAGQTQFNFTGGTDASFFSDMQQLFNTMRVQNDGVLDKDDDINTWTTTVPIYDAPCDATPIGLVNIVGFATITITSVTTVPNNTINAEVICGLITGGQGGGQNLGTFGSIPNLVR